MSAADLDLDALTRLAEAARAAFPHSPWQTVDWNGDQSVIALRDNLDYGPNIAEMDLDGDEEFDDRTIAAFEFMAAVDPATVVALVERLRAAESAVELAFKVADRWELNFHFALPTDQFAEIRGGFSHELRDALAGRGMFANTAEAIRTAPESDRDGQNDPLRDSGPQNAANEGDA